MKTQVFFSQNPSTSFSYPPLAKTSSSSFIFKPST